MRAWKVQKMGRPSDALALDSDAAPPAPDGSTLQLEVLVAGMLDEPFEARAEDDTSPAGAVDVDLLSPGDPYPGPGNAENGEFHTCVSAGPMFREPIPVEKGETVERDGFVFQDLLPASEQSAS